MKIQPLRVKLLSPMFNYCRVTTGGAITSDFIGDIALTYAINRVRKDRNFYEEFRRKPYYEELRGLDYYVSMGKPVKYEMTGIYTRNTLFNVDGFPDMSIIGKEGLARKGLFKNYFKVQGIQPEGEFSTCLICKDSFTLDLPFTIRLGTGRECMAILDRDDKFDGNLWLNAFTLKTVFGNLQTTIKSLKSYLFEYKLENYILMKNISTEQVRVIFDGIF
ncbi:MAG: type I-D CRISPR-associated protein Cas5/Csc1 [Planctomycetia bacterium]|nr:type I-D CRISPR-associated protein Cas5/Csc1 [Planctomycetia bacterium]